jgi:2-methylcitrate dehydratase PrpD
MTTTHEEKRREAAAARNAAISADIHASELQGAARAAAEEEQVKFDALLKNPDFQRWIREMWLAANPPRTDT